MFQGRGENERQHPQSRQRSRLDEEFPPAAERVEDGEDRSDRHPALRRLLVAVLGRRSHRLRRVKTDTPPKKILPPTRHQEKVLFPCCFVSLLQVRRHVDSLHELCARRHRQGVSHPQPHHLRHHAPKIQVAHTRAVENAFIVYLN